MDLFFPVSEDALALFKEKMNAGIQHTKDNTMSIQNASIEATLIKVVGSYISNPDTSCPLKDLTSFMATHVSVTEYGRMALTDALWFWGTQVGRTIHVASGLLPCTNSVYVLIIYRHHLQCWSPRKQSHLNGVVSVLL